MQRHIILVCHAVDGSFADGDREGVRRVLDRCVVQASPFGPHWYTLTCPDNGTLDLYAPGLEAGRAFHRMEIIIERELVTSGLLALVLELMRMGGFGLLDGLDTAQFIVTEPQQVGYFPRLPEPPLLVRSPRDLAYTLL